MSKPDQQSEVELYAMRHSLAHIMATATEQVKTTRVVIVGFALFLVITPYLLVYKHDREDFSLMMVDPEVLWMYTRGLLSAPLYWVELLIAGLLIYYNKSVAVFFVTLGVKHIRVRLQNGRTGLIPEKSFDPETMERL